MRQHPIGVKAIELHTGPYARLLPIAMAIDEFAQIKAMTQYARKLGMVVNAGHGLNYENTYAIARIKGMAELNIGHAIMSRAVFVGLKASCP
jgi:pyridoxine 5-phosphate synthase